MVDVTATNIDEFNEQARSFAVKAKEAGKSNTAIANTIKFMYGLYAQKQAEQPTYQLSTNEYGEAYAFDPKTGELMDVTPAPSSATTAGSSIESEFDQMTIPSGTSAPATSYLNESGAPNPASSFASTEEYEKFRQDYLKANPSKKVDETGAIVDKSFMEKTGDFIGKIGQKAGDFVKWAQETPMNGQSAYAPETQEKLGNLSEFMKNPLSVLTKKKS